MSGSRSLDLAEIIAGLLCLAVGIVLGPWSAWAVFVGMALNANAFLGGLILLAFACSFVAVGIGLLWGKPWGRWMGKVLLACIIASLLLLLTLFLLGKLR